MSRYFIQCTYKLSFISYKANFVFENMDNIKQFSGLKLVPQSRCFLVNGAGVDTEKVFTMIRKMMDCLYVNYAIT